MDFSRVKEIKYNKRVNPKWVNLPNEYQQLDYIIITGESSIDTNYVMNEHTCIDFDFYIFRGGYQIAIRGGNFYLQSTNSDSVYSLKYDSNNRTFTNLIRGFNTLRSEINKFNINNQVYEFPNILDEDTSTIKFGCINNTVSRQSTIPIVVRIKENEEYKRNFIACKRKSDGVLGFYDLALSISPYTGTSFYTSETNTKFIAGNETKEFLYDEVVKIENDDIELWPNKIFVKPNILWLDGIKNVRNKNNPLTTIWEDLTNDNDFRQNNNYTPRWNVDSLRLGATLRTEVYNNTGIMNELTEFTIELVTKARSNTSGRTIFHNGSSATDGFRIYTSSNYGCVINFRAPDGVSNSFTKSNLLNNLANISVTYKSGILKFYINGTYETSFEISYNDIKSSILDRTRFEIGNRRPVSSNEWYEGDVYSVRIHNKALTDNEILANWNEDLRRFTNVT